MKKPVVVKVAHRCGPFTVMADVEDGGKYWWGYINNVRLSAAIDRCPFCGDHLPQAEEVA